MGGGLGSGLPCLFFSGVGGFGLRSGRLDVWVWAEGVISTHLSDKVMSKMSSVVRKFQAAKATKLMTKFYDSHKKISLLLGQKESCL